ncbi:hypothetical protein A2414_03200 [candidate division WWE3 bacterium RIFOXYC1_FULL_42_13]|nr:MAG: hypothetical protein A2414_03200 [candidate division WWE3 bacterium RIFOXYC1_FULL_42_13]
MLEKYLPFLKRPEKPGKNLKAEPQVSDDTLFFNPESLREEAFDAGINVKISSSIVIFLSLILIGLLVAHLVANFFLNGLLNEQKNLEFKINGYPGVEEKALQIADKINYSKKTVNARRPLTTRISFVMSRIPQGPALSTVAFNSRTFDIAVKGSSPAQVTGMFLSWLRDGEISEVTIKEAVFSSSENTYLVRLGGVYR